MCVVVEVESEVCVVMEVKRVVKVEVVEEEWRFAEVKVKEDVKVKKIVLKFVVKILEEKVVVLEKLKVDM